MKIDWSAAIAAALATLIVCALVWVFKWWVLVAVVVVALWTHFYEKLRRG